MKKNNNNKVYAMTNLHIGKSALMLMLMATPFFSASSYAQEEESAPEEVKAPVRTTKPAPVYEMKSISGTVFDAASNAPVSGARIQAYGLNRYSTMTEEDGTFTIKVPVFATSLYVTSPEYNDVQVAIGGESVGKVLLYSNKFNSFYSPQTQVTSGKVINIVNSSALSIDSEIENRLGGDIHTISRTGVPGQGVAMFLRGLNSININSQPLIILDGIMMDMQLDRTSIHDGFFNNVLSAIDPEDIESVEVMKNATSLYGSRGGNGVILINTKRGHSMATKINVSAFAGIETAPKTMKVLDGNQYRNYVSELIGTTTYGKENSTASASIPFLNDNPDYYWYPLYHNNTDWSDDLYRTAFTQNYKVNVQGGDDIAMYSLSLGYANSNSTAKGNQFDRLNIRFNTDINLVRNLSTQLDVAYSRTNYDLRDNGWAESYNESNITSPNVLGLIQAPFISKYNYYTGDDAKLHLSQVYSGKNIDDQNYPFAFASKYVTNSALSNPYWILENGDGVNKNHQEVTQFNLNVMPRWDINKHLYLTNRFAYQLNRASEKYYLPEAGTPTYNLEGMGDVTSVKKSLFDKETSLYEDFRISWSNNYGQHDISAFGGFRFTSNSFTDSYMTGYNGGNDKMPDNKTSDKFRSVQGTNDSWRNLSYYAQANYSFRNTYFVQGSISADASSRFGKETSGGLKMFGVKWGLFPSLQAGWVITNESWFNKVRGVDYLKFTAGYDISGNDNVNYSASRTYFQATPFLKTAIGLQLMNIENPEIQWETTHRWNFALNGSFVNNRIQAGIDFYVSNTDNLLTMKSINYMTGLNHFWCNDGSLRNIGAEVNVNALIVNSRDFKWQLGATLGHYKNRITSLPEDDYTTKIYGGEVLTSIDNPVGLFYGYKTAGVFSSDKEASTAGTLGYLKYPTGLKNNPYNNFRAGDVHFVDMNNDGVINESDKTTIGDPNPDIYGNIFTNFSYKHWTLDFTFKYSLGNDIYNYNRRQLESVNNFYNQSQATLNRWTCEGQVTDVPRVCSSTSEDWVNNERFSDRWIEDGSFIKLKNVRLSYALPLSLSWIQGITIWGEANNLFVVSRYTGNDPETSCNNSVLYQGIDAGLLPVNRSFNLGVKFNL